MRGEEKSEGCDYRVVNKNNMSESLEREREERTGPRNTQDCAM